jgi:hypothetical protein
MTTVHHTPQNDALSATAKGRKHSGLHLALVSVPLPHGVVAGSRLYVALEPNRAKSAGQESTKSREATRIEINSSCSFAFFVDDFEYLTDAPGT